MGMHCTLQDGLHERSAVWICIAQAQRRLCMSAMLLGIAALAVNGLISCKIRYFDGVEDYAAKICYFDGVCGPCHAAP